mmetsp:Transcript_22470/g.52828  ORF Transcript_22470/g.52828 Transcript_22470/m.52828 type:complete len:681 (-) Transcript_22470:194-2236(-)
MGNIRTKLALVAAALGAQGVQVAREGALAHSLEAIQPGLRSPEEGLPGRAAGSGSGGEREVLRASEEIQETARLLEPNLLQSFMALTQNYSQLSELGNRSSLERLGKTESRIIDAIDAESTALFEEWHTVERQSVESAARLARLAAQSANFSGSSFVQQVALQSASIVQEMKALEQQSASKNGKAGPSHAFPQAHVVSRPGLASRSADQQSLERVAKEPWAPTMASVGGLRLSLALACLIVVLISAFLSANRKTTFELGKKRMLYVRRPLASRGRSSQHALHDAPDKAPLSVWDGTVATFSTIVGTGLLAMPYAFSLAGLAAIPVIIFFIGCSIYTAHLMSWALTATSAEAELRGVKPGMRGWGFLVEVAFGRKAKSAINTFLIVELWGYLLSSTVCCAMNVEQIAEDLSTAGAIGLSVCVCYALSFVPAHVLTKVNVLSNTVFIACCAMFLITGLLLPERAPASDVQWVNPRGLVSAVGILVFSPAGHGFYPSLMQSMEEPFKFPTCVRRAYAAAAIVYLLVAVAGYQLFGLAAQPSLVQNIGGDLHLVPIPHLGWMNTLAAVGMVIKMLSMQGLVLSPLSSTVEGMLGGLFPDSSLSVLVAPVILAVSAGVALHFATEMATLMNLIGSVFCMNIAFVVPTACYWKLQREPVGLLRQIVFITLIVLGGACGVLGVMTTL